MLCDGQFVVAGVVVFCCSCVVAVLWNGYVAVALWRYCGAVALCCSAFWCGGTRLYFAQWRPGRVYILHNGILATFTFLRNGIHVCVFAQWYSCLCFCTMVFYHNRAKNASILL